MELNREQCIDELDFKTRYAKFVGTDGVSLSAKCAQFCLEHAQFYEEKIKELTEENERLRAELEQRPPKLIIAKLPKKESKNV
jgi:hypothetical protein